MMGTAARVSSMSKYSYINKNKGNRQFFSACRCGTIIIINNILRKTEIVEKSQNVKKEK
jgi:hypothetical protein